MEIRTIKNNNDYNEALKYIEDLIDKGVRKDSVEAEKLDVLVTLVQDYESKMFPAETPDPIDALEFVMEQRSLSQEDLVPYIGSRSKVSEVLARKRPLSVNMMRALHDGLGIPAKTLLNQSRVNVSEDEDFTYEKFPIKEMIKRGYIKTADEIKNFFSVFDFTPYSLSLRRTYYVRSSRTMNQYALQTWMGAVVNKSKEQKLVVFAEDSLDLEFLKKVIDLSDEENAIPKVRNLLNSVGIYLIAEPNMPQTYLDGASIMLKDKNPIIGITIRHDRLDNFWFTLLHELAHIMLHYNKNTYFFYDDIESIDIYDPREKEADELALQIMIPKQAWENSPASILPSPDAAKLLAKQLSIHPAIVAGKMRYERKHYHFLNDLLGKGEVSRSFSDLIVQK